jgi:hypothetical protein
MTWNYRIVKRQGDNQDNHSEWFEVVETFYEEDGTVSGWTDTTTQPLRIVGDTVEELIEVYEMILKDLKKNKDDIIDNADLSGLENKLDTIIENSIENVEVIDMPDGSAKITMDIEEDAQAAIMKQGMQYLIDEMKMHDKVVVMEPNEFTGEAKTWELSDDERNALFHFGFIHAVKLGMKGEYGDEVVI